MESRKYLKNIKVKLFSKLFKLSNAESLGVINDIEKSVFESTLTNFLLIKEENYFAYTKVDDQTSEITEEYPTEGTLDFLDDIKNKKENKYNKGYKNKRINKIFNKSRDEKYEVDIFEIHGCILNFEQFRLEIKKSFAWGTSKITCPPPTIFFRKPLNNSMGFSKCSRQ